MEYYEGRLCISMRELIDNGIVSGLTIAIGPIAIGL